MVPRNIRESLQIDGMDAGQSKQLMSMIRPDSQKVSSSLIKVNSNKRHCYFLDNKSILKKFLKIMFVLYSGSL